MGFELVKWVFSDTRNSLNKWKLVEREDTWRLNTNNVCFRVGRGEQVGGSRKEAGEERLGKKGRRVEGT